MSLVRRDGELSAAPPYGLDMTDVLAFVVRADRAKLQALCDRELNLGPLHYTPLGDFVVFYGARIGNHSEGTVLRTHELGVWVPVVRGDELLTYSPYVWIDSSTSMHVGREIFGYPKLVGTVGLPNEGGPAVLEAHGDALALRHGVREVQRDLAVRIEGPGPWRRPPDHGAKKWLDLVELGFEITRELLDLKPTLGELASLLGGMRSVFLKQLPSAGTDPHPVYQALIEAAVKPKPLTVSGDLLEGTWKLVLPSHYEEPRVAEVLGLVGGVHTERGYEVAAIGQGWLELEGTLEAGVEVWRR